MGDVMDKYVSRSSDIASRMLGDEMIIMSTVNSTLFSLNPAGTAIWQAADGKTLLSQIIQEKICTEFDVTNEQACTDAEEFVSRLAEHGILHISEHPVTH
jgi:chemotaxis protein CheY-P-specific phosphatase CheC